MNFKELAKTLNPKDQPVLVFFFLNLFSKNWLVSGVLHGEGWFWGPVLKEKIISLLKWLSTRSLYLDLLQLIIC
jgi:hypothetical protein